MKVNDSNFPKISFTFINMRCSPLKFRVFLSVCLGKIVVISFHVHTHVHLHAYFLCLILFCIFLFHEIQKFTNFETWLTHHPWWFAHSDNYCGYQGHYFMVGSKINAFLWPPSPLLPNKSPGSLNLHMTTWCLNDTQLRVIWVVLLYRNPVLRTCRFFFLGWVFSCSLLLLACFDCFSWLNVYFLSACIETAKD